MKPSNLLRRLLLIVSIVAISTHQNHSADLNPTPDMRSLALAPSYHFSPSVHHATLPAFPELEKGHFFQFLVEEVVHIHEFCFDRLRRRRKLISQIICGISRFFLMVIHLNIVLYHVDHILHHQLHYLLKTAFS